MGGGATGQFERDGGCPRLPIGVTSFRKMAEEGFYFVDKTLLIRDVIDDGAEVVLFTRPRRFGKTLNMDMLRVFFELPIEGGGEGGDAAVLFRDKAIWACGERYTAHQGAYPVVFLTFKDVKFPTWSETLGEIAHLVQLEALRHGYLLESAACNEAERSGLARLCRGEGSTVELAGALCRLGLALTCAVLVLKFDIVLDLVARIEQLVQAHAIELGERNQVLGIGRALRTLPFTDRLTRQAQLSRQPLLTKTLAATKVGEPLRSFYIHGSSYVIPAVPPDRFIS